MEVAGKAIVQANAEVGFHGGAVTRLELSPPADRVKAMQNRRSADGAGAGDDIFVDASAESCDGAAAVGFAADFRATSEGKPPIRGSGPGVKMFRAGIALIAGVFLAAVVSAEA